MKNNYLLLFIFIICIYGENTPLNNEETLEEPKLKTGAHGTRIMRVIFDEVSARYSVLREELVQKRGWTEVKTMSNVFDLKMTYSASRIRASKDSRSIVNHYPTFEEVGKKHKLFYNLVRLQRETQEFDLYDFIPRTYIIGDEDKENIGLESLKADFVRTQMKSNEVINSEQTAEETTSDNITSLLPPLQSFDGNSNIWIVKPVANARGVGIEMFDNLTSLISYTSENKEHHKTFVVQKYIENPMLIKDKKFDIRQFVMVASLDPVVVFLLDDCYLRFCTKNYTHTNLTDRFIHLTNHQVQKNSDEYNTSGISENQWSLSMFKDYLRDQLNQPDLWESKIKPQIAKIAEIATRSWPKEGHRRYSFEFLGLDLLIDDQFNVYLIEVNTNPGLHMLTDIVRPHHTKLQLDMLKVVLDNRTLWENASPEDVIPDAFGSWKLIYDERKNKKTS